MIISGVAGLLAGAFSMAAGEWVSMNSQRELFEREIAIERQELKDDPEFEVEELALIYHKRGMPLKEARAIARKVMKDPKHALDTHVREELGLNPDELGSPWSAAWSSFVAFSIGGILPVIPFFFLTGPKAILLSAGLAAFGLFTVGAFLSKFTGKFWLWSGLRMLLIGSLAAAVTYLVGSWLGVNIN
jgi:VIT1/CCC1 family predicted Fe2+/Mn2+ transporter